MKSKLQSKSPGLHRRKGSRKEESDIQSKSIKLFDKHFPHIAEKLFSIPNESPTNFMWGNRLNRMGRRKGVWDCFLSLPTNNFCGLYIEFKTEDGDLSKDQIYFREKVGPRYGYTVVRSPAQFFAAVQAYLKT